MPRNNPGQLGFDLAANFVTNGLNKPDNSQWVYDYTGGFNVVDYMITASSAPRRVEGLNGVFQKPLLGQGAVVAEVSTSAQSGANVIITLTDPTFDNFRNKFVLSDGTAGNNQGRVIAHSPGSVTIEPTAGTPVLDATTFAPGTFGTSMFEAAGNRGSEGVESLFETPSFVSNQTAITRESVELFRRDFNQTYVTYKGGWWAYAQQPLAVQRYSRALEFKAIWGAQGANGVITGSTLEGDINYSGGLKEAILDPVRGGIYRPQASLYTEDDFIEWVSDIANQNSSTKTDIPIICGREALKTVQQFPSVITSVLNTGTRTTFTMGESVRGLDVTTYSIAGINCHFIQAPALNDTGRWPAQSTITGRNRMQYTMMALDMDNYNSVDGRSLPAAEKVYFGDQEVEQAFIMGVGVGKTPLSASSVFDGNYQLASSQRDGIRYEIYSDCAYDFMAYNMGWMELTS